MAEHYFKSAARARQAQKLAASAPDSTAEVQAYRDAAHHWDQAARHARAYRMAGSVSLLAEITAEEMRRFAADAEGNRQ